MSMRETRAALEPVVSILRQAGFWAYPLYGDEGWLVACDTESGRIDVRIGTDGYLVEVWDVSPGLYFDEEDERKRAVKERLARLTLSRLVETIRHAPVTGHGTTAARSVVGRGCARCRTADRARDSVQCKRILAGTGHRSLERLNELLERLEERLLD
jgi:hypothetical protein